LNNRILPVAMLFVKSSTLTNAFYRNERAKPDSAGSCDAKVAWAKRQWPLATRYSM